MITLRRADERGHARFGGLDSQHRFSFGQYHDPEQMGWGPLCLIASSDGRAGSLAMKQDTCLYAGLLESDERVEHVLAAGRRAYVHLARGELALNGRTMRAGDGAKIKDAARLSFAEGKDAEFLLFDLP